MSKDECLLHCFFSASAVAVLKTCALKRRPSPGVCCVLYKAVGENDASPYPRE